MRDVSRYRQHVEPHGGVLCTAGQETRPQLGRMLLCEEARVDECASSVGFLTSRLRHVLMPALLSSWFLGVSPRIRGVASLRVCEAAMVPASLIRGQGVA